jgi:hypothetical protein
MQLTQAPSDLVERSSFVFVVVHDYELFCTCLEMLAAAPNMRVICEPDPARAAAGIRAQRPALVVVDAANEELERAAAAVSAPVVWLLAERDEPEECRARLAAAVRNVAARSRSRDATRPF